MYNYVIFQPEDAVNAQSTTAGTNSTNNAFNFMIEEQDFLIPES